MKNQSSRPLRIILRTEDDNALAFAKALSEGNFLLGILPSFGKCKSQYKIDKKIQN